MGEVDILRTLNELNKRVSTLENTFNQHELDEHMWQSKLEKGLLSNTETLGEIKDILLYGKGFFKAVRIVGKLFSWLAPFAVVGSFVWGWLHGVRK